MRKCHRVVEGGGKPIVKKQTIRKLPYCTPQGKFLDICTFLCRPNSEISVTLLNLIHQCLHSREVRSVFATLEKF